MNKQIGYITSAHLILISVAASYFFISKISSASNDHNQYAYNSVSSEKTPVLSGRAAKGKTVFMSRCASCHHIFREIVGPPLAGFENRGPWSDRKKLYEWIRNPRTFMTNDPYTKKLKEKFDPVIMDPSPNLTDEEIDSIVAYIKESEGTVAVP